MSRLGLLALSRSFAGGRKQARPLRLELGALPRFNVTSDPAPANQSAASSPPAVRAKSPFSGARSATARPPAEGRSRPDGRSSSFPSLPLGAPVSEAAPVGGRSAGDSFWTRRPRRHDGADASPLSLGELPVARNDLRDSDVEVLLPLSARSQRFRLGLARWRQWLEAWFRMGR